MILNLWGRFRFLFKARNLTRLWISYNNLNGELSSEIGNLENLTQIELGGNELGDNELGDTELGVLN